MQKLFSSSSSFLALWRCSRQRLAVPETSSIGMVAWATAAAFKKPMRRQGLFADCRWVFLASALWLASCRNDKVEVYKIPKEEITVAMQNGSAGLVPPPGNPAQWTKPDGWSEQSLSEMRLGSFKVDGPNGSSADVSVIAFPGEAGGLISNLNRWRGQLQLEPLDENQLSQMIQRTEVDNAPTYLVDFQTAQNAPKPSRILGAVLQTADRAWFVKMAGPPELIESQRQKFLDFVKSFHFTSSTESQPPAPAASAKSKSTNDQ
jgi:hypothetical protein